MMERFMMILSGMKKSADAVVMPAAPRRFGEPSGFA